MEDGVLELLWCSYPSLELALAEGVMGSAVSAPAAWEFELILDSGLMAHQLLSGISVHLSFLSSGLLGLKRNLLFPVYISDLMFWVCFVLFCFSLTM